MLKSNCLLVNTVFVVDLIRRHRILPFSDFLIYVVLHSLCSTTVHLYCASSHGFITEFVLLLVVFLFMYLCFIFRFNLIYFNIIIKWSVPSYYCKWRDNKLSNQVATCCSISLISNTLIETSRTRQIESRMENMQLVSSIQRCRFKSSNVFKHIYY